MREKIEKFDIVKCPKTHIYVCEPPEPDPGTGLLPCGCGGKAIPARLPHPIKTLTCVACETCFVTTPYLEDDEAKDVWNRAMGWREGNEN